MQVMSAPGLIRAINLPVAREVWEDRAVVIAIGHRHEPSAALGLQVVFVHQLADLFWN